MVSTAKKNRKRKAQREAVRTKHQMDPVSSGGEEDTEIAFLPIFRSETDPPHADPTQDSPPTPQPQPPRSPASSSETQYGAIMDMVRKLNNEISSVALDNNKIRTVCEKLLYENRDRDRADRADWISEKEHGPFSGTPSATTCFPAAPHHPAGVNRQ